ELEEERNAAATAASETMSMILRLQREKAEVQMEARQFRRFAEEKMAHDGREIAELDDLLFKREQQAQALSCEVRAYKNRLLSLGFNIGGDPVVFNSDGEEGESDIPGDVRYPPLRCGV
ncbi:myosin-binding protein 7-like, partial [Phalaenopsis equestris]|uniref:myosin-binding protein 7-like n=1 Tax=Phalaenopsis equestris TaxID=78828 RepID=UPI0009E1AA23